MAGNVLTWKTALAQGCRPSLYSYLPDKIPLGDYVAMLDFKIWAREAMAINCYFTVTASGQKFQLTVYCREGVYKIKDGGIDFTHCPIATNYRIEVVLTKRKKVVLATVKVWSDEKQ